MPTSHPTTIAPACNSQVPATWLKPDEPLVGADGRDWSWCYVWHKDIEGFPGYKVGSDGSVWTCRKRIGEREWGITDEWRRLVGSVVKKYLQVTITSANGKFRSIKVHRLVMEAFVGKRPPGMECRHLDGNGADARLSNLCWGTPKENGEDRIGHGTQTRGVKCHLSRLDDSKVREIRRLRRQGMPIAAIGRQFGVSDVNVSYICLRRTWTHVPD